MTRTRLSDDLPGCAMEATAAIIGGKWKGAIMFDLLDGPVRFNELQRQMQRRAGIDRVVRRPAFSGGIGLGHHVTSTSSLFSEVAD